MPVHMDILKSPNCKCYTINQKDPINYVYNDNYLSQINRLIKYGANVNIADLWKVI